MAPGLQSEQLQALAMTSSNENHPRHSARWVLVQVPAANVEDGLGYPNVGICLDVLQQPSAPSGETPPARDHAGIVQRRLHRHLQLPGVAAGLFGRVVRAISSPARSVGRTSPVQVVPVPGEPRGWPPPGASRFPGWPPDVGRACSARPPRLECEASAPAWAGSPARREAVIFALERRRLAGPQLLEDLQVLVGDLPGRRRAERAETPPPVVSQPTPTPSEPVPLERTSPSPDLGMTTGFRRQGSPIMTLGTSRIAGSIPAG